MTRSRLYLLGGSVLGAALVMGLVSLGLREAPLSEKIYEETNLGFLLRTPAEWSLIRKTQEDSIFPGSRHHLLLWAGRYGEAQAVFAVDVLIGLPATMEEKEALALGSRVNQFLYDEAGIAQQGVTSLGGRTVFESRHEFDGAKGRISTRVISFVVDRRLYVLTSASPAALFHEMQPVFTRVADSFTLQGSSPPSREGKQKALTLLDEADRLFQERDVDLSHVSQSLRRYQEAHDLLVGISGSFQELHLAREGMKTAQAALEEKYRSLDFEREKALRLGQTTRAAQMAFLMMRLIPDPNDERHRRAKSQYEQLQRRD